MWSKDLGNDNQEGSTKHNLEWKGPVHTEFSIVLGFHVLRNPVLELPLVHENLFVGKHPVSVHQEDQWSPLKFLEYKINQVVIESWRKSYLISWSDSFAHILVEKVKSCNWEENWKTKSIEHCDPHNIEHCRALEMDDVVSSEVEIFICSHRSLLSFVNVIREALVQLSQEPWFDETNHQSWVWQKSLNEHCLNDLFSYVLIPFWWVIVI